MVAFLTELLSQMKPLNYLVSIAVGGAQGSAEKSYNIREVAAQVDFINMMTYDLHGPWESVTGINGAMYAGPADVSATQKQNNVDACVKYWLSAGAPASKLIVGIPTYGKSFTLSNQGNHGVGASSNGGGQAGPFTRESGTLGYNEVTIFIQPMIRSFNNLLIDLHEQMD